jgi:hypothetical protein
MSVFRSLIVLIFLLLAVGVVNAQEETPAFVTLTPADEGVTPVTEEAPTVVVDDPEEADVPVSIVKNLLDGVMGQFQTMSNVQFGLFAVFVIAVVLPTIYALYNSNPTFRSTIKTAALEGYAIVEKEVEKRHDEAALNDQDWDDPVWKGIYDAVKSGRLKLENLGTPNTITGIANNVTNPPEGFVPG